MHKKCILVALAVLLLPLSLAAKQFSSTFNEEYAIFGFSPSYGYRYSSLYPWQLLDETNFLTPIEGKATPKTILVQKSIEKGTLSFILVMTLKGTKVAKMQVNMQTNEFAEKNYITYVALADLIGGQHQSFQYDGGEESLGECIGSLQSCLKLFYNLEKLKPVN